MIVGPVIATAAVIIGGNPYLFILIVLILQSINFLLYYNVTYGTVLKEFLIGTGEVGLMNFIPNPLEWFMDLPDLTSPENFEDGGYGGLFLTNQEKLLFIAFLLVIAYLSGYVLYDKEVWRFKRYSLSTFKLFMRTSVIRILIIFYSDIMTSVCLQFWNFEFNSNAEIASGVMAFVGLAYCVLFPVYIVRKIGRMDTAKYKENLEDYEVYLEDYDLTRTFSKYYLVISLTRRFLHQFALVLFYKIPILQIFVPWMLNCGMIGILIFIWPHHVASVNIFELTQELCLFFVHSTIMILAIVSENSTYIRDIAEDCLYVCIGIMLMSGIVHMYMENKDAIGYIKKILKLKRVVPVLRLDFASSTHAKSLETEVTDSRFMIPKTMVSKETQTMSYYPEFDENFRRMRGDSTIMPIIMRDNY